MKSLILPILLATMANELVAAEKETRCYEMRTYFAAPGKLEELHARFRDHTCKLFEKHGMVNIGYWVPQTNSDNRLIYLLSHASRDAAKKSWADFVADPEWKKAQKASEANGKLVDRSERLFLEPVDYSPALKPSAGKEPRVFEMRTYTASQGNLDALNARFRDHTVGFFTRHGMEHIGYWTPMKGEKGAGATLIYILAHKSTDAAAKSFAAFRADPDWLKARADSEKKAGGPLTEGGMAGVASLFMNPTDYSSTQ